MPDSAADPKPSGLIGRAAEIYHRRNHAVRRGRKSSDFSYGAAQVRNLFAGKFFQHRLVLEGVHLAHAAFQEQKDHGFGLGRDDAASAQPADFRRGLSRKKVRQCERSETEIGIEKESRREIIFYSAYRNSFEFISTRHIAAMLPPNEANLSSSSGLGGRFKTSSKARRIWSSSLLRSLFRTYRQMFRFFVYQVSIQHAETPAAASWSKFGARTIR